MIKEYINKLSDENKQDLNKLEKQMKDLLQELSSAEKWSETLLLQNNSQRNIFSPRNMDTEIESKIEKNQISIQKTRQEIEYVRDLIETHVKKNEEYEKMLSEIDNSGDGVKIISESKIENITYNAVEKSLRDDKEICDTESSKKKDTYSEQDLPKEYVLNLLSEINSKTEKCLALLNRDKNRCKKELLEIKAKLKKCAEEIQNK